MKVKERVTLAPQYVFRFSCIGTECEDTCCQGWRVFVEEETYKKFRRLRHPELKPLLDRAVKRNRSNPSPRHYAKIVMDHEGKCPLLSAEGLCRVHQNLGETYLPSICSTYPRVVNEVDGVAERSLTVSCPEAARLALLNPEPMEFDQVLEPAHDRDNVSRRVGSRNGAPGAADDFWRLRVFTIGLLQNRDYALWERVFILGLFMQRLESSSNGTVDGLITGFRRLLDDGSIKGLVADIPSQTTIQLKMARELLNQRFRLTVVSKSYVECVIEFLQGIECTEESTDEEVGERYWRAYSEHYAPFMSQHEYILENYLVNYVFKNLFPLGPRGYFGEYIMLVLHYALLKMHLIGMAGYHKGLTKELVIRLIYSFSRVVEHSPPYLQGIYELLQESNLATMPYMAILIKN